MLQFKDTIKPFFWVDHEETASVCLSVGNYKSEIFQTREDDGFEGNGYDWTSLAKVFLDEQQSQLVGKIQFDSEAGLFCAYSSDIEALKSFILAFKETCEDTPLIMDLFSRAELD